MLSRRFSYTWGIILLGLAYSPSRAESIGSAFTYQGRIEDGGVGITGPADFRFSLWNAETGGNAIGTVNALSNVEVQDGLFNVQLDFSAGAFDGDTRWLQIAVRAPAGSGPFTTLAPRQPVIGTPYATQTRGIFVAADLDVGIGTVAPNAKLHVSADTVHADLHLQNTYGGVGPRARILMSTPNRRWSIDSDDGLDLWTVRDATANADRLTIDANGNIGIGTVAPDRPLTIQGVAPAAQWLSLKDDLGVTQWHLNNVDDGLNFVETGEADGRLFLDAGGDVGIGTTDPTNPHGFDRVLNIHTSGVNAATVYSSAGTGDTWSAGVTSGGNFEFFHSGPGPDLVSVPVLRIVGGADLAEPFEIGAADGVVAAPGMVVTIDPAKLGELRVADRSYDTTVAGIISGAGGVKSGLTLQQKGSVADGSLPVALTGRVWCLADTAASGPIKPGDLLTSSATPGHAMKAADAAKAQGAIIGKAMSSLENGRGLVLVLVSLQ